MFSSRFCQSSRRAVDSSGSAPGSPSTSSTTASTSSGSTNPTRPAGSSTRAVAPRPASVRPGPGWHRGDRPAPSTWRSGRRSPRATRPRRRRARSGPMPHRRVTRQTLFARLGATRRRAPRAGRQRRAAGRPGEGVGRPSASGSCAADTSTRRSSSIGLSPGRISRRSSPPAREHASASAGSRPARRTDDFPLPDGPAMPRKPASTSRATSSATSYLTPEEVVRGRRARSSRGP